jgi:hypothetical protein
MKIKNPVQKVIITCTLVLLNTFSIYAQQLTITEVDAAATKYYNDAAKQTLGKKLDLTIDGSTINVKINNETLVLKQSSAQCFTAEREIDNAVETFSIKINTTSACITSAEFTGAVIQKDGQQKKEWWTITARKLD